MATLASHLREQGFVVVASGVVADGLTKIYACARGVGVEALFFAELVRACVRFTKNKMCLRVTLPTYMRQTCTVWGLGMGLVGLVRSFTSRFACVCVFDGC